MRSLPQSPEKLEPARHSVPTGDVLVHHPFLPSLEFLQLAESRRGYAGSNKAVSVERDSLRKEQFLEPLALFE